MSARDFCGATEWQTLIEHQLVNSQHIADFAPANLYGI